MAAAHGAREAGPSPEGGPGAGLDDGFDDGPYDEPPREAVPLVLAEPGQRLCARIVDTLVVGLPVVMVLRETTPDRTVEALAPPIVAALLLVYETVQLAVWGRTLGKRFAGIKVVRAGPGGAVESGERPSRIGVLRSLLRAAVYALPIAARPVPVLGLVAGLFWVVNAAAIFEGARAKGAAAEDQRRQAVHDRLAGTLVVKAPAA